MPTCDKSTQPTPAPIDARERLAPIIAIMARLHRLDAERAGEILERGA